MTVLLQGSLKYDMYTAKNGVLYIADDIYFAGWSYLSLIHI